MDASKVGLGAMLSHSHYYDGISERLPMAYVGWSLNEAEWKYRITKFESLAVLWAISHFKTYIFGMNFTIITDYSALKALKDKPILTGCLLCRAEKLLEYDFDIIYCAGKKHVVPDFLSEIYLTEISVTSEIERNCCLAQEKNKNYIPF